MTDVPVVFLWGEELNQEMRDLAEAIKEKQREKANVAEEVRVLLEMSSKLQEDVNDRTNNVDFKTSI